MNEIKPRSLAEFEIQNTEHAVQFWWATPPAGTKREEILVPEFWKHVSRRFKAPTMIEIMPMDGAWYAKLMVLYADLHSAKVKELQFVKLGMDEAEGTEITDYYCAWISPAAKYGVKRRSDKVVMQSGFATMTQAVSYMNEVILGNKAA